MDTITINGRDYAVEVLPHDDRPSALGRPRYQLTGARGATYTTFRNRPKPDRMFLVSGSGKVDPLGRNLWLTDRDGALRLA